MAVSVVVCYEKLCSVDGTLSATATAYLRIFSFNQIYTTIYILN